MDKVPSSAAVNESVELAKKNGLSYAAGLINAVLRKIDKNGLKLPSQANYAEYLSIKYSVICCGCNIVSPSLQQYYTIFSS
jgi:16S rRNA (cytosine967-C5)-methyltransferase